MIENGHYYSALILVPLLSLGRPSRNCPFPLFIWHGQQHPLLGLLGYFLESAIRDCKQGFHYNIYRAVSDLSSV